MPEQAKRKDLPKPDFPEVKIVQAGGGAKSEEPVNEDAKTEDEA